MKKPSFPGDSPLIISVVGSNRGVGKSLISTNIAIQLAQAGMHVILIDHELSDVQMRALHEITDDNKAINPRNKLENFLTEEGVPNLLMIPGSAFGLNFSQTNQENKKKFFDQIKEISSADIVILDLGGESTESIIDNFLLGHVGLIVTTPEPDNIIGCYEFLRNAAYRTIYRVFKGQEELQQVIKKALTQTPPPTIPELAAAIAQHDPWVAENLLNVCADLEFHLILNKASASNNTQQGMKLYDICRERLNMEVNFAGMLFFDNNISELAKSAAPLSISSPESVTVKGIRRIIAVTLAEILHQKVHNNRKNSASEQLREAEEYAKKNDPNDLLYHA